MKKIFLLLILISTMTTNSAHSQEKDSLVLITTEFGNIKLKLYDDTPLHKENFKKLINEGFYKDLLFHRVIKNFMIQGGDPNSRNASDTTALGSGDLGYTIPAEIKFPKHFNKRGALAAARTGNDSNPEKESSASQFYIVTGKTYSEKELNKIETERVERQVQALYNNLQADNKAKIKEFYSSGDRDGLAAFRQGLYAQSQETAKTDSTLVFSPEQRLAYTKEGGAMHLDGEYTVFGEVVEGMDVIEKIQQAKTDKKDRPIKDIKMDITLIPGNN